MFNTARYDAAAAALVTAAAAQWTEPRPAVILCPACEHQQHEGNDTAAEIMHGCFACHCPCNTRRNNETPTQP